MDRMDVKERWLLTGLSEQIGGGTFDERDVLAFLILLRRHTPNDHLVRELGDFVAHRERDRGMLRRYLADVQRMFDGLAPGHWGGAQAFTGTIMTVIFGLAVGIQLKEP